MVVAFTDMHAFRSLLFTLFADTLTEERKTICQPRLLVHCKSLQAGQATTSVVFKTSLKPSRFSHNAKGDGSIVWKPSNTFVRHPESVRAI